MRQRLAGCVLSALACAFSRSVVDALSGDGRIRVVTCVLRDGEQYKTLEELNKARHAA